VTYQSWHDHHHRAALRGEEPDEDPPDEADPPRVTAAPDLARALAAYRNAEMVFKVEDRELVLRLSGDQVRRLRVFLDNVKEKRTR